MLKLPVKIICFKFSDWWLPFYSKAELQPVHPPTNHPAVSTVLHPELQSQNQTSLDSNSQVDPVPALAAWRMSPISPVRCPNLFSLSTSQPVPHFVFLLSSGPPILISPRFLDKDTHSYYWYNKLYLLIFLVSWVLCKWVKRLPPNSDYSQTCQFYSLFIPWVQRSWVVFSVSIKPDIVVYSPCLF